MLLESRIEAFLQTRDLVAKDVRDVHQGFKEINAVNTRH